MRGRAALLALLLLACDAAPPATQAPAPPDLATRDAARWFRGNTHTHTLWSDGDSAPELAVDWYRQHGYQVCPTTVRHSCSFPRDA